MPKGRVKAVVIAVIAPVLLQMILEVFFRWLPSSYALTHGFSISLINVVAIGGLCFFRVFRPRAAAALMLLYIPVMMFVMFGTMSAFVWFAYGDAL